MKADRKSDKILMIINEFPPTGESGVQRPLKFLKYLSLEKWETFVITPAKLPKNILDYSLLEEIPKDTHIFKTHSLGFPAKAVDRVDSLRFSIENKTNPFKRLYWKVLKFINDLILPIDKQIGWVPFAFFKAVFVIKKYHIRNVYITAYPFSAFLVGILLKKVFGKRIFWVADYRDSWEFDALLETRVHAFRRKIIHYWDASTLEICDKAIFVTEHIRDRYISEYPWVENKSVIITNGYDEDDFKAIQPTAYDCLTFLYMGKIYSFKGNPIPMLKAFQAAGLDNFQYVHIGTITADVQEQITENRFDFYHFLGYKSHSEALNMAAGADINVIILNDDEVTQGLYSGKVFELIRIGRPILVVGPVKSIVKDLIEKSHAGVYACINSEEEIIRAIHELVGKPGMYVSDKQFIAMYSRENLTNKLIEIYNKSE